MTRERRQLYDELLSKPDDDEAPPATFAERYAHLFDGTDEEDRLLAMYPAGRKILAERERESALVAFDETPTDPATDELLSMYPVGQRLLAQRVAERRARGKARLEAADKARIAAWKEGR